MISTALLLITGITAGRILLPGLANRRRFLLFACAVLWTALILRDPAMSPDTPGYMARYDSLGSRNLGELASGGFQEFEKDRTFWIASKALNQLGISPQGWLAALSLLFCIAIYTLISRFSTASYTSIIATLSLGYVSFSATALRQSAALSLLIIATVLLTKREYWKSIALILAASLLHSSALFFLIALPLLKIRSTSAVLAAATLITVPLLASPQTLSRAINQLGWTENLAQYAEQESRLSWTVFFIHALIVVVVLVISRHGNDRQVPGILLNLTIVGLVFAALATQVAEAFRVGLYFSVFEVALLPSAIFHHFDRSEHRDIALAACSLALIVYGALLGVYTPLQAA